jgi:hypothetical protein
MMANWLRSVARRLASSKRRPSVPHRARRARVALECLEDRLTPSTTPLLAVTSFYDSAVYQFNANTGALMNTLVGPNSQLTTLQNPAGITVGPDGNLYISSQGNDSIVEYNLTSQKLTTLIPATGPTGLDQIAKNNGDVDSHGNPVFGPAGIAFGPDGDLYVALSAANGTTQPVGLGAVVRFGISNNGGQLSYNGQSSIMASGPTLNVPTGLIDPTELTFGVGKSDIDTLYVSNSGAGSVVAIPHAIAQTPGTMTMYIAAGSGAPGHTLNFPSGLAWAPNGNLEVVDLGATTLQGQVLTFGTPGAPASTTITAGSNGQALPQGTIDVGSTAGFPNSGSLFINAINTTVSYTGKTATSFTGVTGGSGTLATGETVTSTVALAPFVGSFAQPLSKLNLAFPSDAVFTSSGQLLTADLGPSASNGQGTIDEFASNGTFVTSLVTANTVAAQSGSDFTPSQLTLNLGNMAPTVNITGNYSINEGGSLTLHATGSDAQGFPLTYTWDINGDGTFGDATGANPTLTWSQLQALGVDYAGTFNVRVIASDGHGQTTMSQSVTLTVNYTPVSGPSMVVTSVFDGAVYQFGTGGRTLLNTLVAPYSNGSTLLTNPAGVTDGPDGNLYISNQVSFPPAGATNPGESIVMLNLATDKLSTFIPTSVLGNIAASIGDGQFVPAGITFGPDGNLYVALNGGYTGTRDLGANGATPGAIVRFDITNTNGVLSYVDAPGNYQIIATTESVGGNNLFEPSGIAFGVSPTDMNNLYVANSGGGLAAGNIVKITGATGANPTPTVFVQSGAEGLSFPVGLAFASNGDLIVTDFGGSAVVAGGSIERFGPKGGTLTPLVTNMPSQFPGAVAINSAGDLFVADLGPNYPPFLLGSTHEYSSTGANLGVLTSSSQFALTGPGDSGFASDSGFIPSALVLNAGTRAPVVNPGTGYSIRQGGSLALSVQAQDPNGSALRYSWDVNGDGTFGDATGANPTLSWAQLVALGINKPGTWQVEVMVADADGHVVTSAAVPLTVFAPPTISISGPTSIPENTTYTLNLSGIDPGHTITHWTIAWNDGSGPQTVAGTATSVTHTYVARSQPFTISATATDDVGTYAASNKIVLNVQHTPPTLSIDGVATVNEGKAYTLDLSGSESAPGHSITKWTINWGDGTTTAPDITVVSGNPASVKHTFKSGPNDYTISATATDNVGTYAASNTVNVGVLHPAPVLGLSGRATVSQGATYTLNLSSTETGGHKITQWTINWGDTTTVVKGNPTSVTHTYPSTLTSYTISATATDDLGTYAAGNTVAVSVIHPAPTLTLSGAATATANQSYILNLAAADPGHVITQWTINWGDGSPLQTFPGNPSVVVHIFKTAGVVATISATATDDLGTYDASDTVQVTVRGMTPGH